MSHAAEIVIPALGMLLIKPSWWARAGAGTPAPIGQIPGNDTPWGSADSGVTTGAELPVPTLPASPGPATTNTYSRFTGRPTTATDTWRIVTPPCQNQPANTGNAADHAGSPTPRKIEASKESLAGSRANLESLRIPTGTYAETMAAGDQILARSSTAVIAFDDVVAHGVIDLLHQQGIDVPGQVSVVGCDDTLALST